MPTDLQALRIAFRTLRRDTGARSIEIADHLGVSEGELIAAHVGESAASDGVPLLRVTRLRQRWESIIESLDAVGEVLPWTRDEHFVRGEADQLPAYQDACRIDGAGLCSLRLSSPSWVHGFAVRERHATGVQRSLRFFDCDGRPVQRVFILPASNLPAFEFGVEAFADEDQSAGLRGPAPATGFAGDWAGVARSAGAGRAPSLARLG